MLIGVNTWVWTSPLGDADIPALAAKARAMGFDLLELPLETLDGYDRRRARAALEAEGLAASSTLVFPPDRDLIHPDAGRATTPRATSAAPSTPPRSSARGRCPDRSTRAWAAPGSRPPTSASATWSGSSRRYGPLAAYAADSRRTARPRAAEPVRDELREHRRAGDRDHRPGRQPGPRRPARHVPHEHRGEVHRRRDPRRRQPAVTTSTPARTTAARPARATCRGTRSPTRCATIEFDGPVVIESFTDQVVTIAAAAAVWRPVAASQDALAADGGAFLRDCWMTGLRELRPSATRRGRRRSTTRPPCACRAPRPRR